MDIVFHAHHAVISDNLRERASRVVSKVASRMSRVTGALVRFEQDGPARRVVIELRGASTRHFIASHCVGQPPVLSGHVRRRQQHCGPFRLVTNGSKQAQRLVQTFTRTRQ